MSSVTTSGSSTFSASGSVELVATECGIRPILLTTKTLLCLIEGWFLFMWLRILVVLLHGLTEAWHSLHVTTSAFGVFSKYSQITLLDFDIMCDCAKRTAKFKSDFGGTKTMNYETRKYEHYEHHEARSTRTKRLKKVWRWTEHYEHDDHTARSTRTKSQKMAGCWTAGGKTKLLKSQRTKNDSRMKLWLCRVANISVQICTVPIGRKPVTINEEKKIADSYQIESNRSVQESIQNIDFPIWNNRFFVESIFLAHH
jgi:hypothetical protein